MDKKSVMLLYVSLGIILASCVYLFSFLYKNHGSKVGNIEKTYNVRNIEVNTMSKTCNIVLLKKKKRLFNQYVTQSG